jgi:phenylalanyl-tRNA synthetase alpha chain
MMDEKIKQIKQSLHEIKIRFSEELNSAKDKSALEELRNKYLGRKRGSVTQIIKEISHLTPDLRPEFGKLANQLKSYIEVELNRKIDEEKKALQQKSLKREKIDISLPGRLPIIGNRHPLTIVQEEIEKIFLEIGYTIEEGPEVETDYYNFEALNIPREHPARDDVSSFFISDNLLLRTHTSPVQIRTMENKKPPIRIIIPGKCYRRDWDIRHTPMFFQIEGLVVDEGITFKDFKGTMEYFVKRLFGPQTKTRFLPDYFPFTEPSAQVHISCFVCQGKGCRLCSNSGWIEILGSGMVHPKLFERVGYDPEKYTGFAWGMGIDRVALLLYGINDARLLYENDLRFLNQFTD